MTKRRVYILICMSTFIAVASFLVMFGLGWSLSLSIGASMFVFAVVTMLFLEAENDDDHRD